MVELTSAQIETREGGGYTRNGREGRGENLNTTPLKEEDQETKPETL